MKLNGISKVLAASLACVMLVSSVGVAPFSTDATIADTADNLGNVESTSAIATAGTTVYVPDDYPTIQAAVGAASSAATIVVRAGTYVENIDVNKSDLTIESEGGADVTVVQAASSNDHVFHVYNVNGVRITGFTIKGATAEKKGGISLDHANSCEITDNLVSQNWVGVGLYMARDNTIRRNSFSNNTYGGGISEDESGSCAVAEAVYGAGITVEPEETLDSLRVLRDNELNPAYVESYYEYSPDMTGILLSNPELMLRAAQLIAKYMPAVKHVLGQGGEDLEITGEAAQEMVSFLRELRGAAADRRRTMGVARSATLIGLLDEFEDQVTGSEGKMFGEAFRDSVYCAGTTQSTRLTAASSANNIICLNNFIDNGANAQVQQSANTWNSVQAISYEYKGDIFKGFLGNYWGSSYTGSDAYGDGVGDTAYAIDGSNRDNYPLVDPFENYVTGPCRPVNISPEPGQFLLAPCLLQSSPFEHQVAGAVHTASHWQIARGEYAFDTPLLDTGPAATHLKEYPVPHDALEPSSYYAWRVRYQDDLGLWSEWSAPTTFRMLSLEDRALLSPRLFLPLINLAGLFSLLPILQDMPTLNVVARPETVANDTVYAYNIGSTVWDSGYRLVLVEGDSLGIPEVMEVDHAVPPLGVWGAKLEIQAPADPGTYEGYWSMQNAEGDRFGNLLRIRLHVSQIHPKLETAVEQLGDTTGEALELVCKGAKKVAGDGDFFGRQVELHGDKLNLTLPQAVVSAVGGFLPGFDLASQILWKIAWATVLCSFSDRSDYVATTPSATYMPDFERISLYEDWGSPLLLETGFRFYPAAHAGKAVGSMSKEDVVAQWEDIMEQGGLDKVAYPLLAQHNTELAKILEGEVDTVLESGLPHLELAQQADYADDLQARREAVQALLDVYLYQSGLPDPVEGEPVGLLGTLRPKFEQEPGFLGEWIREVLKIGVSVVAGLVAGPWASIGVSTAFAAAKAYGEMQKRNEAEQLFFAGLNLLAEALRVSVNAEGNALEGLGRVQHGDTPCVVTGDVGEVKHLLSKEWGFMTSNYTYYTTVDVKNRGLVPATFVVLSQYMGHDDEAPHVTRSGVTLDPDEKGTVHLMYCQITSRPCPLGTLLCRIYEDKGIRPAEGSSIIVTVLAVNEAGTFFVDQDVDTWDPVEPQTAERGATSSTGIHQVGEEALLDDFPIHFVVYAQPDDMTYQGNIWLNNPLEHPLSFNITQPLLPDITVLEAEGGQQEVNEEDASITLAWEETLEPDELKLLSYRFAYEGDFVPELQLPAVEVSCFDPGTEEVLLEILLEVPLIEVPLPISAAIYAPVVVLPEEAIEPTVSLVHRLEDGDDATGLVQVSLLDLAGQVMRAEVQAFNVTSAGAQNLTFSMPGIADKGRYELVTEIEYEDVRRIVDIRSVRVGINAPRVRVQAEPGQLVFVGEKLAYTVEVENATDHVLTTMVVSLETPSSTQVIPDSISEGGQLNLEDSHLVQWECPEALAPGEETAFSVRVEVGNNATESGQVSLLTARAWVETSEALQGTSSQALTFVAEAPESLVADVRGQVLLEGRDDHGGTQVQVGGYMTSTDFDGHFVVEAPAGHYVVTVTRRGFLSSVTLEIDISASQTLKLDTIHLSAGAVTQELPSGVARQYYEATLEASGGMEPYMWEIVAGYLPDGLGLDTGTGVISGTPTKADTFPFTVQVSDDQGLTSTRVLAISIAVIPGDANGDDAVNILDIVLIGQHWAQTGTPGWIPEDVNKDGAVNVLDLVMIGQHWTG